MVKRKHKQELGLWLTLGILSTAVFIYSIVHKEVFFLTMGSLFTGCIAVVFVGITLDKIHKK